MTTDKGAAEIHELLNIAIKQLAVIAPRNREDGARISTAETVIDRARKHITALAAERDALKEECERLRNPNIDEIETAISDNTYTEDGGLDAWVNGCSDAARAVFAIINRPALASKQDRQP